MELKEIVALYRRWLWLLIAGLVLGLALGFLASKIQTPVFEATTKVLVARNRQQGSADILSLSDQQLVATYQQLLKTQSVLDAVGSKLGVKVNPSNVRVEVLPNTQIIQITVDDTNASQAVAIANSLVQVLIDQNETLQAGRYAAYEDGLNTQIAQVQQQIKDLQGKITQLGQANIQEQLAQVNQQITNLQEQILGLQTDIAQSPTTLSSVERANLVEKQAQLSQLRSLLSLYQQIQTNLTYIGQPMQGGSTQNDPQITSLQSTLNLYQQLYLSLLNNLEAVKLARAQSTPTVNQIETAVPPENPVRPLPLLYTALAGMVGLVLGAAAALLIDYFDDSFNTAQKVQELLQAPVIGYIGETGPGKVKWLRRSTSPERDKAQLENAFGSLRINLQRLMARRSQKTVLVTSPWRGEGKTTVSANLARSFAQSGKRVILVDADLSHPQIHMQFGLENHVGLADILAGGVDWQEVSGAQDEVTIITSGTNQKTAAGLLESDKMTDLLKRLQQKADIVIVDGPPLFVLNAQVLASRLGVVLMVVQQGQTKTSIARSVKDQLKLMDIELLGVVMNRVPRTDTYYYDGYMGDVLQEKPKEKIQEVEPT